MINGKEKLIVAIDTDDFDKAKELIDQLEDSVDIFKVGLEQYVATKGRTVEYLREKGKKEVFTCMLLVFLPIFAPNKFPLLKK